MNTNCRAGEIGRREFLVLSSTAAVATATLGPKLFADPKGAVKRLAVGFVEAERGASLAPASRIPAGDGAFISRGVRIAVSGASGVPASLDARRTVELRTHFPYFEGAERREAMFLAWGSSRRTGNQGYPVSFVAPVDVEQKVLLSVAVESGSVGGGTPTRRRAVGGATSTSQVLPLTLSLTSEADTLKLVRGFYVIVPLFENDGEPRWSDFTLDRKHTRWALVDGNGEVAPFEHFVVRIDYATV
jgi:hypothetical protein